MSFFAKLKSWVVVGAVLVFAGCESGEGVRLADQAYGLNDIRAVIAEMCGGKLRQVNPSNREMESPYYSRKKDDINFDAATAKERLATRFQILGDRRPYQIYVQVNVEKRVGRNSYELVGEDPKLSEKTAQELEKLLHESLGKRNMIDDFRPF